MTRHSSTNVDEVVRASRGLRARLDSAGACVKELHTLALDGVAGPDFPMTAMDTLPGFPSWTAGGAVWASTC
jgi:hypothetical protein